MAATREERIKINVGDEKILKNWIAPQHVIDNWHPTHEINDIRVMAITVLGKHYHFKGVGTVFYIGSDGRWVNPLSFQGVKRDDGRNPLKVNPLERPEAEAPRVTDVAKAWKSGFEAGLRAAHQIGDQIDEQLQDYPITAIGDGKIARTFQTWQVAPAIMSIIGAHGGNYMWAGPDNCMGEYLGERTEDGGYVVQVQVYNWRERNNCGFRVVIPATIDLEIAKE